MEKVITPNPVHLGMLFSDGTMTLSNGFPLPDQGVWAHFESFLLLSAMKILRFRRNNFILRFLSIKNLTKIGRTTC